MVERAVAAAPRAHGSACELRRCSAAALRTAQRVPTLKTSGCLQGTGTMQKKYKTKVLSLGTWPTKGPGFRLAVDAWRAFTAGLEPLEQEDVPAHDDRVTQLVAAAQQAARQVRLDPACTQPNPTLPSPLPSPHTTPQPPSETILRLLLLLTLSPPSACPQPIISMPSACPSPTLTLRSPCPQDTLSLPYPQPQPLTQLSFPPHAGCWSCCLDRFSRTENSRSIWALLPEEGATPPGGRADCRPPTYSLPTASPPQAYPQPTLSLPLA